uniref:Uncharacterized protein n=1 Tax=Arundo donax TaxID=35708 RepID=A0A0A9HWL5_ARUDO
MLETTRIQVTRSSVPNSVGPSRLSLCK